jgi:lipopolysaccharide heptosyltransferase II
LSGKEKPVYKKILIINPFGIGDVLFTTPIIRVLRDAFASIKIGYLCNRRTAPLLENNSQLDSVFVYERDEFEELRKISFLGWAKKYRTFLGQLRKEHFDLVFDFSLNSKFGFFSWYAGIKERIGYDFKKRGRFLTKKIKLTAYDSRHIVEYYVNLLKYAGIPEIDSRGLELYIGEEDKRKAAEILTRENVRGSDTLIGIVPGAGRSWGERAVFKHWPAGKFSQLADKIVELLGGKIIILGDSSEQALTKEVIRTLRHKPIDLTGKTSIRELAGVLIRMRLVVTNDGGPLHMAAALGVKTVSIFGPVDEKVYGPYPPSDKHIVITNKNITCRPCYKNFRFGGCSYNLSCVKDITVDEVFTAVKGLL